MNENVALYITFRGVKFSNLAQEKFFRKAMSETFGNLATAHKSEPVDA